MIPPPPVRPAGFPLWTVIGPCLGAMTALYLLGVPLTPLFSRTLARDFGVGSGTLAPVWLFVVAALLTAVAGALLGGRYPATVGASSVGVIMVGELLCAFAPNIVVFDAGRVVAGLGAGVVVAGAIAVATRVRPQRGLAIGLVIGLGVLAIVVGAALSGALTATVSWRTALMLPLLPLVVAVLATVVIGIVAKGTARSSGREGTA